MPISLTGAQHQIAAGDYLAVVTELGAGLRELRFSGRPVLAGYEPDELPPAAAGQLLAPWPNRVDGGRYEFAGAQHQLDLSEPARGNAIHGLTRWMPWTAVHHTEHEVGLRARLLGRTGYPFCLDLEARYRLTADGGLLAAVSARNIGTRPAPYGTGSHPYLTTGQSGPWGGAVDDWKLTLPCSHWQPTDDRGIPSGSPREVAGGELDFRQGRRIGTTRLDHAFTGLSRAADGRAWARLRGAHREVALWAGAGYEWLQVFTGDALGEDRRRRALAVEPMTCPPNAFVTGNGLLVLQPGESVVHEWGIGVRDLGAAGG